MDMTQTLAQQRAFFQTGGTLPVSPRLVVLQQLYDEIRRREPDIHRALAADLGKSETESYMTEVGLTLSELRWQMKHVRSWAKPQKRRTALANFHARSMVLYEPYGLVLVMAPWNYPFLLCMEPLIGAIAAGNCVVVKPSAYAPNCARIIEEIITAACPAQWVSVVQGGREENSQLLRQRFDYIFFTGSVDGGRRVMEAASRYLTPVTLELGGKSPCIVDNTADLKLAARRIVFGKLVNCGQTCVAPDYVLVDRRVEERLVGYMVEEIRKMYGENPLESPDYGHIINEKHFRRIARLIDPEKVVYGGQLSPERLQIAPTIMRGVTAEDAVMQEEIFGPILPILSVETMAQAEDFVLRGEKPLALYVFTKLKPVEQRFLQHVSFGGGCVNDTLMHLASSTMGFGGVGSSGMGAYHGKYSFQTFSHEKSILKKSNWMDLPLRYPPYGSGLFYRLIRLFLR